MAQSNSLFKLAVIFIIFIIAVILIKSLASSLFLRRHDRLNFVVYDREPSLYSLARNVDYQISFFPDLKIYVPGGYSLYRLGALGKLISLDNKPEMLRKTFSLASGSFVNFYFYPRKTDLYYGAKSKIERTKLPDFHKIFLYRSNANVFDRIYIFLKLSSVGNNIRETKDYLVRVENSSSIFDQKDFLQKHLGFFYQKTYRDENKTVQIIYSKSYRSAFNISSILEGNGIKVVDLSGDENSPKECRIIESETRFSKTASDIADFLHCKLEKANTKTSDIIIRLGSLEREWE